MFPSRHSYNNGFTLSLLNLSDLQTHAFQIPTSSKIIERVRLYYDLELSTCIVLNLREPRIHWQEKREMNISISARWNSITSAPPPSTDETLSNFHHSHGPNSRYGSPPAAQEAPTTFRNGISHLTDPSYHDPSTEVHFWLRLMCKTSTRFSCHIF